MTTERTSTREATYFGRRARITTTLHQSSAIGERTVTTEWLDDATIANGGHRAGTVTRKRVKGDGRRDNFRIIEPEQVINQH